MIISCVRRCGKSTLIRQKFLKNKTALYINFEDPRLVNFSLDGIDLIPVWKWI